MCGADDVAILTDIRVKHAAPVVDIDAGELVHDTLHRGCADAIIVTGQATGSPVDASFVDKVQRIADPAPVFVGSVVNAAELTPLSHGAIVGTIFNGDGVVQNPVDRERVRRIAALVQGQFLRPTP